jgi:hypothetical protein
MRKLAAGVFAGCARLAAVAFPAELAEIACGCFTWCTALEAVDLAVTAAERIDALAFALSGLVRVSLPVSLRELDLSAFRNTALSALDLSVSANVTVKCDAHGQGLEVTELRLPQKGFAELAATLLPDSRVEVLYADVDVAAIEQLRPRLDEWAIDRLRVVSPRLEEPFEWVGSPRSRCVAGSDPAILTRSAGKATATNRLPRSKTPWDN